MHYLNCIIHLCIAMYIFFINIINSSLGCRIGSLILFLAVSGPIEGPSTEDTSIITNDNDNENDIANQVVLSLK